MTSTYLQKEIRAFYTITDECQHIKSLIDNGEVDKAKLLLLEERLYPLNKSDYPYII